MLAETSFYRRSKVTEISLVNLQAEAPEASLSARGQT